jgi:hypothetical protein
MVNARALVEVFDDFPDQADVIRLGDGASGKGVETSRASRIVG